VVLAVYKQNQYQNMIDLVVCLSIRRGPGVFMDAAMGEHGAFNN
jgi:hypothetical protein